MECSKVTMSKNGIIIWGAGNTANQFLRRVPQLIPDYFIDSDINKKGTIFMGYEVKHPTNSETYWKEKTIIVASIFYNEIKNYLEGLGLRENIDFVDCNLVSKFYGFCEMEKEIDEKIKELEKDVVTYRNKSYLFFCLTKYDAVDKGLGKFFETWSERQENSELILAQEATWLTKEETSEIVNIASFILPSFLGKGRYVKKNNFYITNNALVHEDVIIVSNEIKVLVEKNDYSNWAACNLRMKYSDMAEGYEYLVIYGLCKFIDIFLKKIQPSTIYLWNEFYALHKLISVLCKKQGVTVKYFEYGNIPGTIQVDEAGQMGESWPAIESDRFSLLPVTEKEIEKAQKVCHYLYLSRDNRKKQPKSDLWSILKEKIQWGKPIILYAGQNDYECGMQPYVDSSKEYHSPIFKTSDAAAKYLAVICKKNGWNLIYKPHPIMCRGSIDENMPSNLILIKQADINDIVEMSDVVVTILSTTAYTSLIRKKPTVMLGYTQLKNQGCTYQAFLEEEVENTLQKAIQEGFSEEKSKKFVEHIARMNKYYLFDDMCDKVLRYGKTISYERKSNDAEKNTNMGNWC